MKSNCYDCKFRQDIPESAHSCCMNRSNSLIVRGDAYGMRHGWFAWPINFDPVWLRECNGFESKG